MVDEPTAFLDRSLLRRLPPANLRPQKIYALPELRLPARLNAASALLAEPAPGKQAALACLAPGVRWSYAELEAISGRLAAALRSDFGLEPGNRVLLRGFNSPLLLASILAVLRAGGVAVPTVPLLQPGELAQVVSLTRPSLLICESSLLAAVNELVEPQAHRLRLCSYGDGELERRLARAEAPLPPVSTAREDPALILFSSGSTGRPKAAMHTHGDILAVARSFGRHIFRASPGDIVSGTPSLAFAYGFGLMLACPLAAGAAIRLDPERGTEALATKLATGEASFLVTAPTAYRKLLARAGPLQTAPLRRCFSAGEPLPPAVAEAWRERTGLVIADVLGSTEMLGPYVAAAEGEQRSGFVGKAVPGYELRLLGHHGGAVDPGESGRLAVCGPTGCCYLDIDDQIRAMQGGWMLTGDICRIDPDGYVAFVGRADEIIVSAGYNISAAEVEAALCSHPGIGECAVTAIPDAERGQAVVALVVPAATIRADAGLAEALIAHVKRSLAPFKAPRRVLFVESLPKTPSGKLRRAGLASIFEQQIE